MNYPIQQLSLPSQFNHPCLKNSSPLMAQPGNLFNNHIHQQFQLQQPYANPFFPYQNYPNFYAMNEITQQNPSGQFPFRNFNYSMMQMYQQPLQNFLNPQQIQIEIQDQIQFPLHQGDQKTMISSEQQNPLILLKNEQCQNEVKQDSLQAAKVFTSQDSNHKDDSKMSDTSSLKVSKVNDTVETNIQTQIDESSLRTRKESQISSSKTQLRVIRAKTSFIDIEEATKDQEKKCLMKQKLAILKAQSKSLKEKLLEQSTIAQKELLLQIQQVSKQNSAKAFLKAYKKFALGEHSYIYNYDISENQYYYKVCREQPLTRIENPTKKDLEGFYRKFKKFFNGKSYNNNSLKTLIRNKLYGQLFNDFLSLHALEWLQNSKSKNKQDLRVIINFLLMCHENPDYLVFLRDHDKSKDKQQEGEDE